MEDLNIFLIPFLQTLLIVLSPLVHYKYGLVFDSFLRNRLKLSGKFGSADLYFSGLVIFLLLTFTLKCLQISWLWTSFLLYLILLVKPKGNAQIVNKLKSISPSWNLALWITAILIIGMSLVDTTSEIRTMWINAYGDLAFHTGMITSFAFGDNFPPMNHIYPGVNLTYPFLVNLWSASLLWMDPELGSYGIILAMQWVTIWLTVYFVIDGDKNKIIPWAILFAGGTYLTLYSHSGENISIGYPWSVFLTTIWIPQRSALFGVLALTTITVNFHRYIKEKKIGYLVLSSLLLSISPLVHTHFSLVMGLYMSLILFTYIPKDGIKPIFIFAGSMIPSLLSLPWLLGKESIIYFRSGWMPWKTYQGELAQLWGSLNMWLHNGAIFLGLLILTALIFKCYRSIVILLIIFIAGNFIHFAVWEWDQIKIFVPLYIITLLLWTTKSSKLPQYLLLATMVPALSETIKVFSEYKEYGIYSVADRNLQKNIMKFTPKDAVILAAPQHNSPVTLTGRKLFMGYPGTLYTHGLDYREREKMVKSLPTAIQCKSNLDIRSKNSAACPDYLLWGNPELKMWKSLDTKSKEFLEKTHSMYIYKIN